MGLFSGFKNTVFLWLFIILSCGNRGKAIADSEVSDPGNPLPPAVVVAANKTGSYIPLLKDKNTAVVANQTSVIFKESAGKDSLLSHTHLVDSLLAFGVPVKKVFAPEHGFRGDADAGEKVKDGVDTTTGLPIISLYGKNRKPTPEQLQGIDIVLFDIQDVGVRFYTYIATLQLVMEAAAEAGIPVLVLDRPNPNAHYIDGPTMEKEHTGFLGMTTIPLVYGMTIGEYATMINEEGWLEDGQKADLTVIPLDNYTHQTTYHLPIRPSPNLPNDQSIALYPSLGLFEGTDINAGRGTEFQFQRYGAPFLDSTKYNFKYTPKPNFGSKYPKHSGKTCYGKDLSSEPGPDRVNLQWLIDAYTNATDKSKVFLTDGFTRHAGTAQLQQQITSGATEEEIRESWKPDLDKFKQTREKYLLYD